MVVKLLKKSNKEIDKAIRTQTELLVYTPFGEKQNQFNDSVSNALDELYQAQLKVEIIIKKLKIW